MEPISGLLTGSSFVQLLQRPKITSHIVEIPLRSTRPLLGASEPTMTLVCTVQREQIRRSESSSKSAAPTRKPCPLKAVLRQFSLWSCQVILACKVEDPRHLSCDFFGSSIGTLRDLGQTKRHSHDQPCLRPMSTAADASAICCKMLGVSHYVANIPDGRRE